MVPVNPELSLPAFEQRPAFRVRATGPTLIPRRAHVSTAHASEDSEEHMSRRNGDRARFQKDRKRKMLRRERIQALMKTLKPQAGAAAVQAEGKAE